MSHSTRTLHVLYYRNIIYLAEIYKHCNYRCLHILSTRSYSPRDFVSPTNLLAQKKYFNFVLSYAHTHLVYFRIIDNPRIDESGFLITFTPSALLMTRPLVTRKFNLKLTVGTYAPHKRIPTKRYNDITVKIVTEPKITGSKFET